MLGKVTKVYWINHRPAKSNSNCRNTEASENIGFEMTSLPFAPKELQCFEEKNIDVKNSENWHKKYLAEIHTNVWSLIGNALKYNRQRDICTINKSSENNVSSLEVETPSVPANYFVNLTQVRVIWEKELVLATFDCRDKTRWPWQLILKVKFCWHAFVPTHTRCQQLLLHQRRNTEELRHGQWSLLGTRTTTFYITQNTVLFLSQFIRPSTIRVVTAEVSHCRKSLSYSNSIQSTALSHSEPLCT